MIPSDEELVRACQRELPYGTASFEILLRRYEPVVFRMCHRYLGRREEAEEATQDIFMRVLRALERFEGRASFRTWLYRVASNVCATRYARLRRETARRAALAAEATPDAASSPPAAPPDDAATVADAMARLADSDREILLLRHVAGLSFEELAEAHEIGLSAAKMRLYRAEERLRGLVSPPGSEGAS